MYKEELNKIESFRRSMREKGWLIDRFEFEFNGEKYIVIVDDIKKMMRPEEKDFFDNIKPHTELEYSKFRVTFIRHNIVKNIKKENDVMEVYVNSKSFLQPPSVNDLKTFFKVSAGGQNQTFLQNLFQAFYQSFPSECKKNKTLEEKSELKKYFSSLSSKDESRKYCYKIRRNGKTKKNRQAKRSAFNDQKTKLYRPDLYEYYGADKTISFLYSTNPEDEKPLNEIAFE